LTLALLDLNTVETNLDAKLASLAAGVVNQMSNAPGKLPAAKPATIVAFVQLTGSSSSSVAGLVVLT
jgi:hypothetical protein